MKIFINKVINYDSFIYNVLGLPNISLMFPFLSISIINGV